MMKYCFAFQLLVILLVDQLGHVESHGRLMDPVARGSRWRFNSSAPADYNDNEGFCGGFGIQWGVYGGKCGLCGNSYGDEKPRNHELGGKFGEGVIVKEYQMNDEIEIQVDITANHKGYFTFDVCNLDTDGSESEECFTKNQLELANGGFKYTLEVFTAPYSFRPVVTLPKDFKCKHCVFRWTYITGNNWGNGPQENFKGCSDISIY